MARALGLAALALLAGVACLEPSSQVCGGDLVCPPHLRCNVLGTACVPPFQVLCGNGALDPGEICDEGDIEPGGACSPNCRSDNRCGNGITDLRGDPLLDEQCDCGESPPPDDEEPDESLCRGEPNSDTGGYCKTDCTLHCGDGEILGQEECDDGNLNGQSCIDKGYDVGTLACTSSCQFSTASCGRTGWYFEPVAAAPTRIRAVWGTDQGTVFAVGERGLLLRHTGEAWQSVGEMATSEDLLDVWGTSETLVYAVGTSGTLVHFDGATTTVESAGTTDDLRAVWGANAAQIFAVSAGGALLERSVSATDPQDPTDVEVRWEELARIPGGAVDLWGLGPRDIYIVSASGRIHHYTGRSTTQVVTDSRTYSAIWGTGQTLVAAGENGAIRRYRDGQWLAPEAVVTTADLHAIWGNGPDELFVAGDEGTVLRSAGAVWKRLNTMPRGILREQYRPQRFVSGLSQGRGRVFAVDDITSQDEPGLWRYSGLQWDEFTTELGNGLIRAVWGQGSQQVFVATGNGQDSGAIWNYDGMLWSPMVEVPASLNGLWGNRPDDIYAVGTRGAILHYDGTAWQDLGSAEVWDGETADLLGVWAVRTGDLVDVFVVGTAGTILHYHSGSGVWSRTPIDTTADITAVWGRSASDVFAVSAGGRIYHHDGTTQDDGTMWQLTWVNSADPPPLHGIWGNPTEVYAVGAAHESGSHATILRHADGEWLPETDIPLVVDLRAVWTSTPSDVYVVGENGIILHYDGQVWTPVRSDTESSLDAVWGTPEVVVFAGDNGTLMTLHREEP